MMNRPISLIEREIETKIDAAIKAELAKGKKPADMGVRDFNSIAVGLHDKWSPGAREAIIREGIEHMVKFVLGAMIAEVVWNDGTGWPADDDVILAASRRVKVDGKPTKETNIVDAVECFGVFRDGLPDLNRDGFHDYCDDKVVERFRALFIGQPDDRTLGEIATVKAARGDPLAMSFLAWRPQ